MNMKKEESKQKSNKKVFERSTGGGAVYGLGLIGAVIYYIQNATSFTDGLLGVLKALVWPAILVYKTLELLGL